MGTYSDVFVADISMGYPSGEKFTLQDCFKHQFNVESFLVFSFE